jgi:hypothetical protein
MRTHFFSPAQDLIKLDQYNNRNMVILISHIEIQSFWRYRNYNSTPENIIHLLMNQSDLLMQHSWN